MSSEDTHSSDKNLNLDELGGKREHIGSYGELVDIYAITLDAPYTYYPQQGVLHNQGVMETIIPINGEFILTQRPINGLQRSDMVNSGISTTCFDNSDFILGGYGRALVVYIHTERKLGEVLHLDTEMN